MAFPNKPINRCIMQLQLHINFATHSIKQTGNLFIGLLYDQPVDDNHCELKIENMLYYLLQSKSYVTKCTICSPFFWYKIINDLNIFKTDHLHFSVTFHYRTKYPLQTLHQQKVIALTRQKSIYHDKSNFLPFILAIFVADKEEILLINFIYVEWIWFLY